MRYRQIQHLGALVCFAMMAMTAAAVGADDRAQAIRKWNTSCKPFTDLKKLRPGEKHIMDPGKPFMILFHGIDQNRTTSPPLQVLERMVNNVKNGCSVYVPQEFGPGSMSDGHVIGAYLVGKQGSDPAKIRTIGSTRAGVAIGTDGSHVWAASPSDLRIDTMDGQRRYGRGFDRYARMTPQQFAAKLHGDFGIASPREVLAKTVPRSQVTKGWGNNEVSLLLPGPGKSNPGIAPTAIVGLARNEDGRLFIPHEQELTQLARRMQLPFVVIPAP